MIIHSNDAIFCDGCDQHKKATEFIIFGSYNKTKVIRLCPMCQNEMMEVLKEIKDGDGE